MTESAPHPDLCHRLRAWAALNERVGDNFKLLAASKTAELCREAAAELERRQPTLRHQNAAGLDPDGAPLQSLCAVIADCEPRSHP